MNRTQIVELQAHIGTEPDGFWGPLSMAACQKHLRALMPVPHPFPATSFLALRAHYGPPGVESALTNLDVSDLDIRYFGRPVNTVRIHRKLVASLGKVLTEIATGPHAGILHHYAGTYSNRNIRGGSTKSLHSWGAAIDLDPGTNGNRSHWPTRSQMPIGIMEAFAKRGWLSAGAFWHRDAMHFQATAPPP